MAIRYRCALDGFTCMTDTDPIIKHIETTHGITYHIYPDETERQKSLVAWKAWWQQNIQTETVPLIRTATEAE